MPPPKSGKKLTATQKELLKQWVAAGAEYEPHWAYIRPQHPEPPKPKDFQWARNPIDSFILNLLEAKRIQPSPEADKRTLLRRLSLDLIGLPPTPAELTAFLADGGPEAASGVQVTSVAVLFWPATPLPPVVEHEKQGCRSGGIEADGGPELTPGESLYDKALPILKRAWARNRNLPRDLATNSKYMKGFGE